MHHKVHAVLYMPDTPHSPHLFNWNVHEHEHIERDSNWFWALGIAAICFAATAILLNNFLFAMIIIAAAVSMALYVRVPPPLTAFEVSERGIKIEDKLHHWNTILSFWVEDDEKKGGPLLLVDTTAIMSPNLVIPLTDDVDHAALRRFLATHCKETPMYEPLSHKILETFGF